MKKYHPASSLYRLPGSEADKQAALAAIRQYYAFEVEFFTNNLGRNREDKTPGRALQPYFCIGCDIAEGPARTRILGMAAWPLYRAAMWELTGQPITLQCYFAQTYEAKAGKGPGGIIGTLGRTSLNMPDVTASRAWRYWNWVDATSLRPYLPEDAAEAKLQAFAGTNFAGGQAWLKQLPDTLPADGCTIPEDLRHDLHALLGVQAMQRLIASELGRDLVLLDGRHVIERDKMSWSLLVNHLSAISTTVSWGSNSTLASSSNASSKLLACAE